MSRRIVIGIDPGANGAIAAVDLERRLVLGVALCRDWAPEVDGQGEAARMQADLGWPLVLPAMLRRIGVAAGDVVELCVEASQLRPGQSGGAAQGWRAGALAASVVGELAAITRLPVVMVEVEVVAASAWTKAMGLHGVKAERDARKRARVARVLELVPDARPMLVGPGCRVEHDGAADAILIALYRARLGRLA
jgi:hypothetical protein